MAIFKKENGQLVDFSNPIPDTSIAPIENGATSTHNYVVGAYALVKGILKKVTNAISIGTAFSDSNSETTDVATELKELNDDVTTINTHLSSLIKTGTISGTTGTFGGLTTTLNTSDVAIIDCYPTTPLLAAVPVTGQNEGIIYFSVRNATDFAAWSNKTVTIIYHYYELS
jgi:hypothetical protein